MYNAIERKKKQKVFMETYQVIHFTHVQHVVYLL